MRERQMRWKEVEGRERDKETGGEKQVEAGRWRCRAEIPTWVEGEIRLRDTAGVKGARARRCSGNKRSNLLSSDPAIPGLQLHLSLWDSVTLSVNNPLHASTHEQRHVQNVSVKHVFVTFKRHQLRSQNFASTSTLEDIKREAYSRPTGSRARRCHTQPMSKFQKHQRGIRKQTPGRWEMSKQSGIEIYSSAHYREALYTGDLSEPTAGKAVTIHDQSITKHTTQSVLAMLKTKGAQRWKGLFTWNRQ